MVLGESAMHWAPDKAKDCAPIQVGNHAVGAGELTIIAGPCAIEEEERALRIAERVGATGADLFRGGAYKPRTSPYAFQGLGADALPILEQVRNQTGLGIITEVLDARDVERVSQVADMLQVGSRNMHNYSLLKELGQASTPVLLKRGFASTIDEWLMAAEYILSGGNSMVVLCERGIRCGAASRKVVLDLGAISELKQRTHLPVFVDPSHGSGEAYRVPSLARAAVAAGADGLLIEVHDQPMEALSDGRQALTLEQFDQLVPDLRSIRTALWETATEYSEHVVETSSGEER
jgi:3-deoxy-7-phosphoheptulonate synthase